MKSLLASLAGLAVVASSAHAGAEGSPRFHARAGAAHAVGGPQSNEFNAGGAGSGTLELPFASRLGVQAGASAIVLAKGEAPADATLARTGTGSAFLGTLGMRLRAFGRERVAGPWIDSNVGVAQTGDLTRPVFDAHLGWDVRVSPRSRLDVGPFVGYTQIFQPDTELRGSDARILTAGIAISLGAKERSLPPPPANEKTAPEIAPPPMLVPDHDAFAEAVDVCPDGAPPSDDGCGNGVRIFEDRILLDDVVHFDFDSARVRKVSHPLVERVAKFINAHPDIIDIRIDGHADEIGTTEYNQRLSEARARSMRDLLTHFGVDPARLRVVAHGKSRPKIVTLKREAQNRRVELFITRERVEASVTAGHGRSAQ